MPTSIPPITPAPSQSTASLTSALARQGAAGPGGELGRDQFLRLLTTQLRYQDPMNPMDGHQLAADLAQFSGLEQLLNINDQLEAQKANADVMLSAVNNSVALGTIGKTVVAAGDSLVLADNGSGTVDGTVVADITTSGTATLEVLDASGRVVGQRSLGAVSPGTQQEFAVAEAASGLQAGLYHSRVVVKADDGALTTETTYFTGRIDGLSYAPDGAVLTSGPVDIPIGSIRRIIG